MKRIILISVLIALLIAAFIGVRFYRWIYQPNTQAGVSNILLIDHDDSYSDVYQSLADLQMLKNPGSFEWVAKRMSFGDNSIKSGRYLIEEGLSNYDLVQKLRLGQQTPVDLVIHSDHTLEELSGTIGSQLELDSIEFLSYVIDTFLPGSQYTDKTILTFFIPNTYEVWWNITPRKLISRLESENVRFWNERRMTAAQSLDLSPTEVYTLASIVEAETQQSEERPVIAGVYLNRLEKNIPLQADPTIRYILRDQEIRRVLYKHLEIDSPYNTYLYSGLPPGPIMMPTIHSIDAVLNRQQHDYLFFCAKPGYDGGHLFASSHAAHVQNARRYQAWLDEQGIR